ncbi:carbohydrate-binding protein [Clostridium sp. C8-1-8]|uniref:carbohydrate-binding protein n=1 Tax=Clostridium sp. C8-1-8 TaxID=2698831 RepID=UPI001369543F|nr:carbohydrate-binding protein [Clostridium sp. C8-1-8]
MKSLRNKILSFSISFAMLSSLTFTPAGQYVFLNSKPEVAQAATTYNLPTNTKDGVILHAFDWSFNTIKSQLPDIAAAGYKSIQVSPVQGTKDTSTDPSKWWLLYQPTNQSVGNAQLGSYDDFKALCTAAKSYGISIIVDVVMNHMANNGNNDQLDSSVDPSFKNSSYYHNQGQCSNWNSRNDITQKGIGMPDLNTQNTDVQNKAITFLNQCVDAGASGFRFDAAKHIETNIGLDANQPWSGNYWTNVLGNLHNKSSLYIYGEILQDGTVDNISAYASFMNVTASNYGGSLRGAITSNNLNIGNGMGGLNNKDCVDFVETHDNYEDGTSKALTNWQRTMGWAIAASRANSTPLFFDRPTSSIGSAGETLWKDTNIVEVNKFHNAMVGQNEYLRWTNNNQTMLIDRGTLGTVVVNAGGSTYLNSATNLANGTYTNHGSASCTLTVSNGTITGNIPGNSIIVLYNSTTPNPTPTPTDRVTWTPTTPVVGSTVTVTYDSSNSVLKGSSSVTAHWGYDSWKGTTDTVMTKASDNLWKVTLTVPTAATSQLNLCFTNGSTWDSNNSANWSISVTKSGSSLITYPRAGYTVDYDSSTLVKGGSFTIYYKGTLANSSKVLLHWGTNGWATVTTTDVSMTKRSDGFWQGTITIPTTASQLDFVFTDGTNWDNNSSKDWHLTVN